MKEETSRSQGHSSGKIRTKYICWSWPEWRNGRRAGSMSGGGKPRVNSTLTSGGARCQGDHLALLFVPATIGTAARATDHPLQTLDGGAPVSLKTVQAEMGHSSFELIERIYSHLPADRPRLEVLEYQPSPADVLADINSRLA